MAKVDVAQFFQKKLVLDLEELQKLCKGRSRCSLFRDLKSLGYFSSYNHAGKFFTLSHIPKFDERGLWECRGARFSRVGTLKNTICRLVNESKEGFLYKELKHLLQIRVENTLIELIAKELISRVKYGGAFLYLSHDKDTATTQLSQRQKIESTQLLEVTDKQIVIEIFLELLKTDLWDVGNIADKLRARGVGVEERKIESVLKNYNLAKKK